MREKNHNHIPSRPSTTRSFNNNSVNKFNGYDLTPTPPVNGHATFIRRNGRQSFNESVTPSSLSMEQFSRTMNYPNSISMISNHSNDDQLDEEGNRQRYRPPSSTTNGSLPPPVKPRKTSTNVLINSSKPPSNHHPISMPSEDEDDANSLEGHRSESDDDDDQFMQPERPNSRLSLHNTDDHLAQQSINRLHRPHYKQVKQANRNPTYDDYRSLEEQNKSKQTIRSSLQPTSNRIGSGSGNQVVSNRLKSGSKSSSTESIPTLDLTVAGQKVFRSKQPIESYLINSLPSTNAMRPPSGRLKPISSAKSTSSYTDDYSQVSSKTLEDVTNNNVKQSSTSSITKTHLYKKRLAPLTNGIDALSKKYSYRPSIDQSQYIVDDILSDRSEETTASTSQGTNRGDMKSSNGNDKRSKHH